MSSGANHETLRILFLAACDLEPREQEIFLEFVCGDDRSLRSQLEVLLQQDPGPGRAAGDPLLSKVGELIDRHANLPDADRVSLHSEAGPGDSAATEKIVLSPDEPRYAKLEQIAEGGMGVILKVWDREFNRPLAMKIILRRSGSPSDQLDSLSVARFLEEAQVTGQLDHPGVVAVHQLGLDEETGLFFTMDLVEGRTLEEIVQLACRQKEGWNQAKVLRVLIKVCETIGYAHSRGVIHRDVKPRNIMVGGFGETYVMDWGLAKVLGRKDLHDLRLEPKRDRAETSIHTHRSDQASDGRLSPLVTADGTVLGTPSYMPPEQAEGRVEELDARSDIYAVGAILYEVLTGQMPYVRPGAQTSPGAILEAVTRGPPTSAHKINPAVPQELAAICEKAMARDKALRYPSSLDVANDLQAFLDHRVVKAYKTGAVAELKSWVVRNRNTAVAAGVAGLLLVAVAVVACVGYLRTKEALSGEALQRQETTKNLYHSLVREAQTLRLARETGYRSKVCERLREALLLDTPAKNIDELRLEAMGCLGDFAGLEPVVWSDFPAPIRSIALDADANQLALGFYTGAVSLRDLGSDKEVALLEGHDAPVSALSFGPGGRILVSGDERVAIKIWERHSANTWVLGRTISFQPVLSLIVVPDGNHLAVLGYRDPEIRMWDLANATWGAVFDVPEKETRCMAVSSDGKLLAASHLVVRGF